MMDLSTSLGQAEVDPRGWTEIEAG